MSNPASAFVRKLGISCNILRKDGLAYGDCVEPLSVLPFLKMADERARPALEAALEQFVANEIDLRE
jgi:hypothetical protein